VIGFKKVSAISRLALALAVLIAAAGTATAERLPIKVYTTADGLAQNAVNRIVRDSKGKFERDFLLAPGVNPT
jgi:hypothetical protein